MKILIGKSTLAVLWICLAPSVWPQLQSDYTTAAADVREGRPEAAIPLLKKMLSASPSDLKARNLLGIALMSSDHRGEATVQFKKALQVDPRFHPALKNLAINELAMGQNRDAKLHFEQAVKLAPKDGVVHFHLGRI